MLLDGVGERDGIAIADRYLEQLAEPVSVADRELVLDVSIGIAVHTGGAETGEDLLRRADLAMYSAKRGGGGHYEVFHPDMAHALGERLGLEHDLRQGLARNEFSVHYQPEVDLTTRDVVGVEALVRWSSPTRGTVMPDRFIPVAEASDFIVPLGRVRAARGVRPNRALASRRRRLRWRSSRG